GFIGESPNNDFKTVRYGGIEENRELKGKNYGSNNIFTSNLGCVFTTNNWQHISWMAEENKSKTQ
ncbi:uncharacterized protein METZ01_LOCUS438093, partial [marine metagenome]